ncbi:UNVERIFIED_CONTAM: hypothetical protein HDU68_011057 [Siphonaria sp. JEL0065]|nr:hypothetical protein HDU68_011057 [Siphonaria sp. JEL0065]
MLNGSWVESQKPVLELVFDDPNITVSAFKIILGRIYGIYDKEAISEENVIELLATASFFTDDSLCILCQHFIESNFSPTNISKFINYSVDTHHGSVTEKIIDAGLLYLSKYCSTMDVWELDLPDGVLSKVLASDCLFIRNEEERLTLFERVLDCKSERYLESEDSQMSLGEKEMASSASIETLVENDCPEKDSVFEYHATTAVNELKDACNQFIIHGYMKSDLRVAAVINDDNDNNDETNLSRSQKLRKLIDANLESLTLSLDYSLKTEVSTDQEDSGLLSLKLIKNPSNWNTLEFPPFRFGVEFSIDQLTKARCHPGTNVYSGDIFHAGSMWLLYIKVSIRNPTLGIFVQRMPPKMNTDISQREYWVDERKEAKVWVQVTAYSASSHRVLDTLQSFKQPGCWGWPAYFSIENAYALSARGEQEGIKCAVVVGLK